MEEKALIERWSPVLKKCTEIPKEDWGKAAELLERAYGAGLHNLGHIADFTRNVLPTIRKPWLDKQCAKT